MPIKNKDRFPGVDFLDEDKIKIIGDIGGVPLALLGFEQGTKTPVVSRVQGEDYFAIPLYELMSHSQEQVSIPDKLD